MSWATVGPLDQAGMQALYEEHFVQHKMLGDQRSRARAGLAMFLTWLRPVQGQSWQQVWDDRAEAAGEWDQLVAGLKQSQRTCVYKAVQILLAHRVVRPSYPWLLGHGLGDLYYFMFSTSRLPSF